MKTWQALIGRIADVARDAECAKGADPRVETLARGLAALVDVLRSASNGDGFVASVEARPATGYRGARVAIEFDLSPAAFSPDEEREIVEAMQAKQRELLARRR